MNLLLDTHSFLWFISNGNSLSAAARSAILSRENTVSLSIVSLWEMTIKSAKGTLPLPGGSIQSVMDILGTYPIQLLHIEPAVLSFLERLAPIHRDPFDRMLVAQAQHGSLVLVTSDVTLWKYPVRTLWR